MTALHTTAAGARLDAYLTTGSSPTVQLLGLGRVGRALLGLLATRGYRVVSASDSSATLFDRSGLDPRWLQRHKERGARLADLAGAREVGTRIATSLVDADIVVDLRPTRLDGEAAARALERDVIGRGASLVLAAKTLALADPLGLVETPGRIGFDAVLGGTGHLLARELDALCKECRAVACVPNTSTTAVIASIERGLALDAAIDAARRAGFVEPDATHDLDGSDAALKLAIVASIVSGVRRRAAEIARPDLRDVDPGLLRDRHARGLTTRLVGRLRPDGGLELGYEAVARASTLAAPAGRVVYAYRLDDGTRVHTGSGVGPGGTARSVLRDLDAVQRRAR